MQPEGSYEATTDSYLSQINIICTLTSNKHVLCGIYCNRVISEYVPLRFNQISIDVAIFDLSIRCFQVSLEKNTADSSPPKIPLSITWPN